MDNRFDLDYFEVAEYRKDPIYAFIEKKKYKFSEKENLKKIVQSLQIDLPKSVI